MEHHHKQLTTELKSIQSTTKSLILAIQKNYNTHKKVLELRQTTRDAVAEAELKSAEVEDIKRQMAELQAENSRLTEVVNSAEAERQKTAIALKDKYLRELVKLERKKDVKIKERAKEADKQGFKRAEDAYAQQCNAAKELKRKLAEKDHQLAFNLAKSVCLPKDMEHHLKQLNTEMKSIRSASKSMILALQKNNITYKKVQELRKTTRKAMAEAEAKAAELVEAEKKMAEMQAENGRLADLVNSAEAEKQKAAIVMKDKYLRELLKLEKRKDAEISELKKNMEAAEKEGYKRGYKEAEEAYVKQCDAAKELFFKCDALQQEFLEDSDTDDSSAPENIPVVGASPSLRLEPMVEDPPIDQPSDTVVPTETNPATERDLPLETGFQVDGDAAFDAEIDELFS
ncbi:flagellar attachment zone protein 1-like [Camellia sinensis]|uniref:flagellar attachment zone protein 1-like n=1 Tax=Camellia sinensis TaxID=4442 RepID=UPI0010365C74|nr:flagellar attachment zone protein 1-like [Camellia sinensis]